MKENDTKIYYLKVYLEDSIYTLENGTIEDQELMAGSIKFYLNAIK